MAYLAFYNKYRPQTFDEVVGQKSIVKTLKNAIKQNKIAHAYLFCGPRGTGKTTMARLFAKALNCQEGVGHQCLNCDSCLKIASNDHPDVVEIDAASNSTVDSVRDLIENVSYQPIMGRYKVYIIDEVHNMSNSAFNALLKTLEEPPSFVVFILATTEPQKIIPTILSRVQRYDFSKVSQSDLIFNLKRVLDSEHIEYEEEAIKEIALLSDGGVRDSLSLLDQTVSYSSDKITLDSVNTLFGLISKKEVINIIKLIEKKDTSSLIKIIRDKYNQGIDILKLHRDMLAIFKDILIYNLTSDSSLILTVSSDEIKDLSFSNARLNYIIKQLVEGYRNYKQSDDILSNMELVLLALTNDIVETTTITKKEVKKEVEKTKEKVNDYLTEAVEVQAKEIEEFKPKVKEVKDEKVVYSIDEIANLMYRASKQDRIEVESKWTSIQSQFISSYKKYAKALYSMKLRLVDKEDKIILVSSALGIEVDKLNSIKDQVKLNEMIKEIFDLDYYLLAISESDFKLAVEKFKENVITSHPTIIDFGVEKERASDKFVNSLFDEGE